MEPLTRPRVLLIAESANPDWISVPLVGWLHSRAIAKLSDAHIATQSYNREAFVREGCVEGKDFTAIDTGQVHEPIKRLSSFLRGGNGKGWTTVMALSVFTYYYFEHLIWREFGQQITDGKFDIVHRLTPLSPTIPSLLAQKCHRVGVPFVLGPLNGGLPWPKEFEATRREEKEWLSYIRWAYKLLPGYGSTRKYASAIAIGSRATWNQIPAQYRDKCVYIPENAIAPERFTLQRTRQASRPLKAIFVGRLVPYKGADMLLEAGAPLIRAGELTVEIVGDGPDMPKLKALLKQEKIESGVELSGHVEHTRVQERLANADLLGFPSIREFGGAVVVEAMMMGLVPIVVDYGGPGELVTKSTGYTVPMGSRAEIVARFREILNRLIADPSIITEMGQRARDRVLTHFTWDAKARQTLEVYRWVLKSRTDKPNFGMPLDDV
ncbi:MULTISPECIES: glycosyltransferase family 4 protein [Cyanophyceae]|uniref:glycosyltransferase family 4 protein n=1 Tax=Cyanophyceae TaxID=3028117 RepID=UPI0016848538|nr:glycosyltransferase family 4 protein [Trichocoleus sp. FACHB-69]MBD1933639.1 glycosyltransferase family 4 protein [Trichocoleus sp. FACHB-69]